MSSQPTPAVRPIAVQIADDVRLRIERGELAPGDSLPTLAALSRTWNCSVGSAREALDLLRKQGLVSSRQGRTSTVRVPPRRIVRDAARHQREKDLVLLSDDERAAIGAAETDLAAPLTAFDFQASYETTKATDDIAKVFDVEPGTAMLRRTYELHDPASGTRQAWSVSHLPLDIAKQNEDLLDEANEPWPGGTQHQLHTVGIEVAQMDDLVWADMPTTADVHLWGLADGVPLLHVRRISIDTQGRVVETSDATYPADRTELRFSTPLVRW